MKFDGKTYLASCASIQLKDESSLKRLYPSELVENISALYKDKELDIPFGSIKHVKEYNERSRNDVEYLQFCPTNKGEIEIDKIEVGDHKNFNEFPIPFHYNTFVEASFDKKNGSIRSLIQTCGEFYTLATATIILDKENDPYKGIYCIEMKKRIDDEIKTVIDYFDGDTLDVLKNNKSDYSMEELTSFSSYLLKRVGFKPDMTVVLDYYDLIKKYNSEMEIVGNTFANGSREKFNKWVDKVFAEEKKKEIDRRKAFTMELG